MTRDFLLKKFVRDYENTKDVKVRERYGRFAGIVGIISNVLLCIMKVMVGLIAGSIAIIADGINNLADASSSIITLVGFKLASLPEDEEHPYGHARIEYLTGLLVSVLIIIVGIQLLRSSIDKIISPDELEFSYATILVLVIAIGIKVWQASFNIGLGKKINSLTLIATGTDSRNDVIATAAVLVSVLISKFTSFQIDGVMGCLVALFIIWSGIMLIKETSSPLLGECPDPELVEAIAGRAESFDGVLGIHDLMVHNYGPGRIFASIHIEVDAKEDIMASHDVVDNIERTISEELHIHLVAHMDPIVKDDPLVEKLHNCICGIIDDIDGVYDVHDLRVVPGPTHTNIIFDAVMSPECKINPADVKQAIENEVQKIDPNYFVVITFDKAYVKHQAC